MRLSELPVAMLDQLIVTWRRRLIAGAIALFFAVAAVIEAFGAARAALVPLAGPAGARLILAGLCVLVVVVACAAIWYAERPRAAAESEPAVADPNGRVTLLAEAVHVGFSLARELRRRPKGERKSDAATKANGAAPAEPEAAGGAP